MADPLTADRQTWRSEQPLERELPVRYGQTHDIRQTAAADR
jgi:hypothetical protein